MEQIAAGIWKITLGKPEATTPVSVRSHPVRQDDLDRLPRCDNAPFEASQVLHKSMKRGYCVELPLDEDEQIYGFGLQLKSFNHKGGKKHICVNADPLSDSGDSHAPVPFYVSTKGYGVFVDTFRYASFYCGGNQKKEAEPSVDGAQEIGSTTEQLYSVRNTHLSTYMTIEVPLAQGVDAYFIGGPDMRTVVQRYNLFSGGGCLPPLRGLGILYRGYTKADKDTILTFAESLRRDNMPCDVLGLEPGWHSHAYSCSYVWDSDRYSNPQEFLEKLRLMNFHVNLWEHAFIHPTSPLYKQFMDCSGDYKVWEGLVPDLLADGPDGKFSQYHKENFVEKGITGFKLDECDSSDYTGGWSFPNCSEFPSGMDGEQMHSALGLLYQGALLNAFNTCGIRTFGQARSSHALAAPLPFVLYSDLYSHTDFIRGVVNAGFSGLVWTPEVRQCASVDDLLCRLQTVVFSAQACINAWSIPYPPWMQFDYDKNHRGEFIENYEEVMCQCRFWLELRMKLLPYLYSSFMRYYKEGMPPFRALVLDYPGDSSTHTVEDEYMMGDALLIAPILAGQQSRKVYLPEGAWYCFWTGEKVAGGQFIDIDLSKRKLPVFVKEGSLLPLARPVEYTTPETCFEIDVTSYGPGGSSFVLYEDDGDTLRYKNGECTTVLLEYQQGITGRVSRKGSYSKNRYDIKSWQCIQ